MYVSWLKRICIIIVVTFPVLILWRSRINLRHKLVLSGIFSLVLVTVGATIIRGSIFGGDHIYETAQDNQAHVMDLSWVLFWSFIEFVVCKFGFHQPPLPQDPQQTTDWRFLSLPVPQPSLLPASPPSARCGQAGGRRPGRRTDSTRSNATSKAPATRPLPTPSGPGARASRGTNATGGANSTTASWTPAPTWTRRPSSPSDNSSPRASR